MKASVRLVRLLVAAVAGSAAVLPLSAVVAFADVPSTNTTGTASPTTSAANKPPPVTTPASPRGPANSGKQAPGRRGHLDPDWNAPTQRVPSGEPGSAAP